MRTVEGIINENSNLGIHHFKSLNEGFSKAKKYVLYSAKNKPLYLLKIYDIDVKDRRKLQFDLLKQHDKNNVSCQQPIALGIKKKEQICYMILSYLRGTSGDKTLPSFSRECQFKLGILAGQELHKVHLVTPPMSLNWYQKGGIGVIDFDSYDWGDPLEDFFKLPKYTIQVSPYFAKGQVLGYFNHKIPPSFWKQYNFFVALNQHASQIGGYVWNHLGDVQERTRSIIETHDFHHNGPPEWFKECII